MGSGSLLSLMKVRYFGGGGITTKPHGGTWEGWGGGGPLPQMSHVACAAVQHPGPLDRAELVGCSTALATQRQVQGRGAVALPWLHRGRYRGGGASGTWLPCCSAGRAVQAQVGSADVQARSRMR